jgi:hypothetical protein
LLIPGSFTGTSPAKTQALPKGALDNLVCQPLRIGLESTVILDVVRARELRDQVRIALLEVPQIMDVAIGQDDEAGDPDEIEANVDKARGLVLRTEFVKKA